MKKIIIIGAGFSGMVCAIKAKDTTNEVILLERASEVGKKILVTGAGRCNYYHDNISIDNYHSTNKELLKKFIINPSKALDFYTELGIVPYIKDGYYYPSTKDASTIRDVLLKACLDKGITIKKNFQVTKVKTTHNKVSVSSTDEEVTGDYLVLATGSKSYYKESNSYDLVKDLVMNLVKPLPSLVQLNTKEKDYLKIWAGVRCNVSVTNIENGHYIKTESGEIQLTDYGISGICVFNLTPHITRGLNLGKEELVVIDFVPFFKDNELIDYLNKHNNTLEKTLSTILNKKVVDVILKKCALTNKSIDEINKREINVLLKLLKEFTIKIESTRGFNNSQVTAGGVPLSELNTDYSLLSHDRVYIVGELVDIDGDCGGYNITFATISGLVAGESIKRRCKNA
ncbi:MAG: aminoacetone oxidase family FAD-binding enzyme [Bacilli bacterium]|nr:aminoacetone oxidase family FAD-binding enzyme [Bacilli bacterium]